MSAVAVTVKTSCSFSCYCHWRYFPSHAPLWENLCLGWAPCPICSTLRFSSAWVEFGWGEQACFSGQPCTGVWQGGGGVSIHLCSRTGRVSLQSLCFVSVKPLSLDSPARCFPFKLYWFPYCNYIICINKCHFLLHTLLFWTSVIY